MDAIWMKRPFFEIDNNGKSDLANCHCEVRLSSMIWSNSDLVVLFKSCLSAVPALATTMSHPPWLFASMTTWFSPDSLLRSATQGMKLPLALFNSTRSSSNCVSCVRRRLPVLPRRPVHERFLHLIPMTLPLQSPYDRYSRKVFRYIRFFPR